MLRDFEEYSRVFRDFNEYSIYIGDSNFGAIYNSNKITETNPFIAVQKICLEPEFEVCALESWIEKPKNIAYLEQGVEILTELGKI